MNADRKTKTDEIRDAVERGAFRGLHAEITETVIGVFFEVYNELGGGFLEGVYHEAFRIALTQAGMQVEMEVPVPVYFRGEVVGNFRADAVVNNCVLVEVKAISGFDAAHDGQVLHYLRATRFEVGLLLNFGPRPQFRRFILEQDKKKVRIVPRESAVEALRDC
jgi:GxxExxY protein